ncbi:MAG: hypothetical protein DMD75_10030 [Candidatus Rokuibacteriota bacterium]|nr:MAG: hypothetical protein DMD75_10030 [Candidatus Rokubacteria bacterium]
MHIVAELTLKALKPHGADAWRHYRQALTTACKKSPPPFGSKAYGDIYRDAAGDRYWMAMSLLANAQREGEGAGQLWDLASCTTNDPIASQVRQHAIDESGHSRAYIALLDLAFPGVVEKTLHAQLASLSPGYTRESPREPHGRSPFARPITLDDLIQMNIAEIRTLIHHMLQRPMLVGHCAAERHHRLISILDALLSDETRHIAYTGALIETFARNGEAPTVTGLVQERLVDFNEITRHELRQSVFVSV